MCTKVLCKQPKISNGHCSGSLSVRSHNSWGGEQKIHYKGVETSPQKTRFKNLERKPEKKSPKRTISANSGLGPLQMVSEPDTERCVSEKAKP